MRKFMQNLMSVFFFGSLAAVSACGEGALPGDRSGLSDVASALTCALENDCDQDGLFTVCDPDDGDAGINDPLAECDEDEDGFVDTPCTSYEDVDGDGDFTNIEKTEIGINCDLCPDLYNPEQEDSDEDGVGDLCVSGTASPPEDEELVPNIHINAEPPADEIGPDTEE